MNAARSPASSAVPVRGGSHQPAIYRPSPRVAERRLADDDDLWDLRWQMRCQPGKQLHLHFDLTCRPVDLRQPHDEVAAEAVKPGIGPVRRHSSERKLRPLRKRQVEQPTDQIRGHINFVCMHSGQRFSSSQRARSARQRLQVKRSASHSVPKYAPPRRHSWARPSELQRPPAAPHGDLTRAPTTWRPGTPRPPPGVFDLEDAGGPGERPVPGHATTDFRGNAAADRHLHTLWDWA